MVRTRKVGAVVALKLDRLFRNCADCLTVVEGWDKAGVALHLVDLGGQAVDTSSAMGRFFLTVMAGAAELERNQIRERTSLAMSHMKTQGERLGTLPYGFQLASDGKSLEPCQSEQEVIRAVQDAANRGLSYRAIVLELEAKGLVGRIGKPLAIEALADGIGFDHLHPFGEPQFGGTFAILPLARASHRSTSLALSRTR